MHYYCNDCWNTFEECEAENYVPCDWKLTWAVERENEPACPFCGSLDIVAENDEWDEGVE